MRGFSTPEDCFKWVCGFLGRPYPVGKIHFRFYIIVTLYIINFLQLILGMRPRWNNFQARYQSIEDLIVLAFMTIIVCEIGWSFNKIVAMVEITKSKLYPASQPLSDIQKSIIEKMTEELLVIIKTFAFIVAGFSLINGFIPFLHGIFFISRRDINNVSQEQIPMPVECWIPYKLENVITYIIFVSPQVLMFAICSFVGFIWFAPFITSLFHLMKEIDILCHSIKDMDYWLKEKPDTDYDFHLKQYFKGVIEHHQNICRTVQQLNEALSVFLFLFNCVCCAQICVSLYSCFEMSDSVSQMKYILLLGPVLSCFYFFCWSGQELINKNGQLERAIADCNWMSKPKWFRSSLRIMILRSSKPLQIKPFGLYTLNFNNIMMVCRAAYSFFNFMHKVQMKSIP